MNFKVDTFVSFLVGLAMEIDLNQSFTKIDLVKPAVKHDLKLNQNIIGISKIN